MTKAASGRLHYLSCLAHRLFLDYDLSRFSLGQYADLQELVCLCAGELIRGLDGLHLARCIRGLRLQGTKVCRVGRERLLLLIDTFQYCIVRGLDRG